MRLEYSATMLVISWGKKLELYIFFLAGVEIQK